MPPTRNWVQQKWVASLSTVTVSRRACAALDAAPMQHASPRAARANNTALDTPATLAITNSPVSMGQS